MKVLITGKGGQLAWELEQTMPQDTTLISLGIENLDITDKTSVEMVIQQHLPDLIINAVAYTAVDKAEEDSEVAYAVNETGTRNLAEAAMKCGTRLFQVSTDFVYKGDKSVPYSPTDKAEPVNVYGASKLAGDKAVAEVMGSNALIVRTAWLYSSNGANFVKTMLRLMTERDELDIISDQVGSPTWARGLALWLWKMAEKHDQQAEEECIIYHWADAGLGSWYDFAVAIQELGLEKGLLTKEAKVRPIPTSAYPTPAKRPAYSVMDKSGAEEVSGLETVHWRKQLSFMMDELV